MIVLSFFSSYFCEIICCCCGIKQVQLVKTTQGPLYVSVVLVCRYIYIYIYI